jgi:predicted HicB family RNase H-like nuclease
VGGHPARGMKDETLSDSMKIRIKLPLKEDLQRLADADGRSLAGYIERGLTIHVEHTEKPKRRASC